MYLVTLQQSSLCVRDTTYLPPPEGAGEFMACTMSVVRASNKLVMNSTFFPSGQPGINQRTQIHQNYLPQLISVFTVQWSWSDSEASAPLNQWDRWQTVRRRKSMSTSSRAWWRTRCVCVLLACFYKGRWIILSIFYIKVVLWRLRGKHGRGTWREVEQKCAVMREFCWAAQTC